MAIAKIINRFTGSVATTNATVTTLITIPLSTSGRVLTAEANVIGKDATPGLTAFHILASFKNVAGTVSQVGATDTVHQKADSGLNTAAVTFAISGTNILVQVQGIAATNMEWFGRAYTTEN